MGLTLVLRELARYGGFSLVGLAHVNHQLRETSARDETFCRDFGDRLGIGVLVEGIDVLRYARSKGLSIEDAARRIRYDFLSRSAESLGADIIAVGHTQDDQAELLAGRKISLRYVGRTRAPSPSEGSTAWHMLTQKALIEQVLDTADEAVGGLCVRMFPCLSETASVNRAGSRSFSPG